MKRSFDKRDNVSSNDKFTDKKRRLSYDDYKLLVDKIHIESSSREITLNDVIELDISFEEHLWFFEYIRILKNMEIDTEERYKLKNMIYRKYTELKNVNKSHIKGMELLKTQSKIDDDIITKILESSHPDSVKLILYKKYKRYCTNEFNLSDEMIKTIEWIDNVLNLPTEVKTKQMNMNNINVFNKNVNDKLIKLWNSLNNNISCLYHVKEKIMEAMCPKILNPNNGGKILAFIGPPGVGKTAIAMSIAESLEMPFDQISLGAIKDSSILTGHSSTYIGSVPGLFTKILLKSQQLDTVLLLDEIDKIPHTAEGNSISSVLLHVLDRTQNNRFRDMYMSEVTLDLSKIIFLSAGNSIVDIDPIVLDRMTIIEINGYTIDEKIHITMEHLFPRIRKELNFKDTELSISEKELKYIITQKIEDSPGMRNVERAIYQLCEKILLLKHGNNIKLSYNMNNIKFPLKIDINIIDKLL